MGAEDFLVDTRSEGKMGEDAVALEPNFFAEEVTKQISALVAEAGVAVEVEISIYEGIFVVAAEESNLVRSEDLKREQEGDNFDTVRTAVDVITKEEHIQGNEAHVTKIHNRAHEVVEIGEVTMDVAKNVDWRLQLGMRRLTNKQSLEISADRDQGAADGLHLTAVGVVHESVVGKSFLEVLEHGSRRH